MNNFTKSLYYCSYLRVFLDYFFVWHNFGNQLIKQKVFCQRTNKSPKRYYNYAYYQKPPKSISDR